jgi:hypothetical protein
MRKLIFILCFLPSLVIAQTQTYSINGMLNIGNRAGYLIGTKGHWQIWNNWYSIWPNSICIS